MKLNPMQIEVLNDNLSKAYQLVELMYQASIDQTKNHIAISDWQEQLERLSIRLDDMRGAFKREVVITSISCYYQEAFKRWSVF